MCWVLKLRLIFWNIFFSFLQKFFKIQHQQIPSLTQKKFRIGKNFKWSHLVKNYSCMSLYMRWPLRNFYTFNYLVESYRNTISKCAVGFMYIRKFHLKISPCEEKPCLPQAYGSWEASFFFTWAIFWRWRNFHTWNSAHSEILGIFLSIADKEMLIYILWHKFNTKLDILLLYQRFSFITWS